MSAIAYIFANHFNIENNAANIQKVYNIKQMEKFKTVLVANAEKKELKKIFKASYPTVREALKGNVTTALRLKIRTAAIARGGMEVEPINIKQNESTTESSI